MPKKLLLADDSVTIQKVISITFASDDYELVVVGDGDSAIEKAKEVSPDIILADIAMPGKTGYEVCEAVKNDPALSHIPVMLLAGTFEPLDSDEAQRVKANDSIVKPFESQELIDKVNAILASFVPRDEAHAEESELEMPDEDFGADAFPGLDSVEESGPDLDFLEGGIFEEPLEQSVAHSENSFADFEISDAELTPEDSSPEPFDISAATASPVDEESDDDFGIPEIGDSGESFSFEPEAESLEVVELESISESEPETLSESTEEPFEIEHFGAGAEPFRPDPEPFAATTEEAPEAVSFEPEASVVDYSVPSLEIETHAPEPGLPEEAVEPEEGIDSFAPEADLTEEPAVEEAVVSEEMIESLDDDFTVEPAPLDELEIGFASEAVIEEVTPEPETELEELPEELHDAALEELEPEELEPEPEMAPTSSAEAVVEAAVDAVTEQSLEAVAVATESVSDSLPAEKVEEIVAKTAREVIEKVAWEVVPELAEELINAEIKKFKAAMLQSK